MVFACERVFVRTLFFYWVIARCSIILRAQAQSVVGFRGLQYGRRFCTGG